MYITKNDNHIEIEVAIKTYYPLIFFFGVGAFFTTLFLIVSICYVLFVKDAEVTAEMFGYLFWSPILISITTWLLRGKEIAVLDGTTIRLIRSNGVFKLSRNLKLCSIKNIKATDLVHSQNNSMDRASQTVVEHRRAIFFWYPMGKISFDYNNKNRTFFNGLDSDQIQEVIDTLVSEIEKRCRTTESQ